MPVKKSYPTVDLLKFLFAIMIVAIHTNLLSVNESYPAWIISSLFFRTAVPFFFAVSGFFLSSKLYNAGRDDHKKCISVTENYCSRLLIPLIFWGIVGLLLNAVSLYLAGQSVKEIIISSLQTVFYPKNAMWYLSASIIGAIILTVIYTRFKNYKSVLIVFACIGYAFLLICNNYFFITEGTFAEKIVLSYMKIFVSARNGFFLAPIYMGMGFLIGSENAKKWLREHKKLTAIGLAVGILLLAVEAMLLFKVTAFDDRGYFVSQLILTPSLIGVSLLYDIKLNLPYALLRRLSTSIYFVHATIRTVTKNILELLPWQELDNNLLLFLITAVLSISLSLISYKINNKYLNKII